MRHQSTEHVLQFFDNSHLPDGPIRDMSGQFIEFVDGLLGEVDDNPETTAGLRKLLEAKDCFVRSVVIRLKEEGEDPLGKGLPNFRKGESPDAGR